MGDDTGNITQPVLLDNTVLTNLALVARTDLVRRLWPKAACTTPSVIAEYQAGVAGGSLPPDAWTDLPVVTPTDAESALAVSLSPRLGQGERTCLAVAAYRHGLFASDDLDARRAAERHGIPTTGTVGILALCVRRGYSPRDQADVLLSEMIASGYRSPVDSLAPLLDE